MIGVLLSQSILRVENPRHPVKRKRYFTRLGQGQTNIDTQKGNRNKQSLANYQWTEVFKLKNSIYIQEEQCTDI